MTNGEWGIAADGGPVEPVLSFYMYYSLRMYFDNGGGPVISYLLGHIQIQLQVQN